MLAVEGAGMDFEWLLDEDGAVAGSAAQRPRPRAPAPAHDAAPMQLTNLSAVSRQLATPKDLADLSAISRSFATDPESKRPCDMSAVSLSLAYGDRIRIAAANAAINLSNMSSLSHNLAHVGAVPQCNQAHAAPAAPPLPVADEVMMGSAIASAVPCSDDLLLDGLLDDDDQPRSKKRAGRRAIANETERLESRRAKNREAAERMRRRRREEHQDLERTVRDLTALVDGLTSKLALSEAENIELRRRHDSAQQTAGV
ncbi:hypothetical protein M885DRAFT_529412 [Pelagophyceae sp. CCMP2097]|nr:hypothetical protein M885DRAFT_529412 [Pelagophyceae sp. CCMP2097]